MDMLELIVGLAVLLSSGAVVGLVPFFVGRYLGKPGLGRLGWLCCMIGNLIFLAVPAAIGFVVAIIVCQRDYTFPRRSSAAPKADVPPTAAAPAGRQGSSLGLTCLAGPLKGQTYRIGDNGIMIGRDYDCAVRFGSEVPGVSRHHCSLRWQQGVLVLTDLNSAFGTFMADGRKLSPQSPVQVAAGSRFYLANTGYLFQIVITL